MKKSIWTAKRLDFEILKITVYEKPGLEIKNHRKMAKFSPKFQKVKKSSCSKKTRFRLRWFRLILKSKKSRKTRFHTFYRQSPFSVIKNAKNAKSKNFKSETEILV